MKYNINYPTSFSEINIANDNVKNFGIIYVWGGILWILNA